MRMGEPEVIYCIETDACTRALCNEPGDHKVIAQYIRSDNTGITIQNSAQKLLDMLNMKDGEAMVSNQYAHDMFEAAFKKQGFAAVIAFLEFTSRLPDCDGAEIEPAGLAIREKQ